MGLDVSSRLGREKGSLDTRESGCQAARQRRLSGIHAVELSHCLLYVAVRRVDHRPTRNLSDKRLVVRKFSPMNSI